MTDVPDPQPPAPEASEAEMVSRAEEHLNDDAVMVPIVELTASARDVLTLAARLKAYESASGEQYDYDTLLYKYVGVRRRLRTAEEALRKIADVEHETNWCCCKQIARRALAGKDAG